jgi:hypothetical protein
VPPIDGSTTTLASRSYCECAYNKFVTMVPYSDSDRTTGTYKGYPDTAPVFLKLNNELKDDPKKFDEFPQNVRDAIATCKSEIGTTGSSVGPVVGPVANPTTTAAG